jgi:hypothetical protein
MAKAKMLCPFSGRLCKDCPLYRGRHYYLCFNEKYRGCLIKGEKAPSASRRNSSSKLEIPPAVRALNVLDPFKFDLFDVVSGENKEEA